ARKIAVQEKEVNRKTAEKPERILIPVSNPENIQRLIDFALLIKDEKSNEPIYPLSIVEDDADADEKINVVRKVIEGAAEQISSGDKKVEILKKVDLSIVDGIARTAKAYNITDILISYKAQHGTSNIIFVTIADNLLNKTKQSVIITKILQPVNSFHRVIVVLAPNAELENGFYRACAKINILLKQIGQDITIYGLEETLNDFSIVLNDKKRSFYKYVEVTSFEHFVPITHTQEDDLFIILSARKQTVSYDFYVDDMARNLNKNNEFTSFSVFYPEISKTLQDGRISDITTTAIEARLEKIKHVTEKLTGIFKKDDEEKEQEKKQE
ncbi:MAG: universal stress protein, partial [Bacteroidia bacterium]